MLATERVSCVKPHIPATLLVVDTSPKSHLAAQAITKALEQASFDSVKLLTNNPALPHAVAIPELKGLEGYSKFMMREAHRYVGSGHALICQFDGYPIHGEAWTDEFLRFDYGGAPFQPSNTIGNGGFSLRSKRLMEVCSKLPGGSDHPEDSAISVRFRTELEAQGLKFMPLDLARKFSFEGRSWDKAEWRGVPNKWNRSFGFHSFLSVLPPDKKPFRIFHHSLDQGDLVYGMAAIKALGGGMLFVSPDNKYPWPLPSRWQRMGGDAETVDNLKSLIMAQDYICGCSYTHGTPFSTDFDLNRFRLPWRNRTARDFDSILKLHMDAFSLPMPTEPWLTVPDPIRVPGRPIVVARSPRYQNDKFPWDRFVQKYHSKLVFVGLPSEAEVFQGFAVPHQIPHVKTDDALHLARVIAGAELFAGNQSLPLAIAHGLYKPVCVECWDANSNCVIDRAGAVYGMPESWL